MRLASCRFGCRPLARLEYGGGDVRGYNRGYANGRGYGGFFTPAQNVKDKLDAVRLGAMALGMQIAKSSVPADFKQNWGAWYVAFADVYDRFASPGFSFTRVFATDAYENAQRVEAELRAWQQKFAAAGGTPPAMPTAKEIEKDLTAIKKADDPFASIKDFGSTVAKLVPWLVGGVALIYLGPPIYKAASHALAKRRPA